MSFYWIYDLPNWLLCILIVAITVGLALGGLFVTRPIVKRIVGASPKHNDLVSYFLGSMGVFYGLALGPDRRCNLGKLHRGRRGRHLRGRRALESLPRP